MALSLNLIIYAYGLLFAAMNLRISRYIVIILFAVILISGCSTVPQNPGAVSFCPG